MNRHDLATAQLKARISPQPSRLDLAIMGLVAVFIGFILATGGTL